MVGKNKLFNQGRVHVVFEISLIFKGFFAFGEVTAGVFAYFVNRHFLLNLTDAVTRMELSEDPRDFVANHVLHFAQALSVGSQHFAAIYLLIHGVIKLWLIVGLWRKKLGYFPVAIAVFVLFIVYQIYRFSLTHSLILLLITVVDLGVIGLTWLEYRHLRWTSAMRIESIRPNA